MLGPYEKFGELLLIQIFEKKNIWDYENEFLKLKSFILENIWINGYVALIRNVTPIKESLATVLR